MMDAVVRAAFKFAGFLDVSTLSHIQGIGSQSLPFNVWVNPAYWPFAFIDSDLAADLGGLIALACFVVAVYVMARCFDLAPVPSAIAAQMCLVLFGPLLPLARFTTVFSLATGFAVVYAPLILALGVLARIEAVRLAKFAFHTAILLSLFLYSIYCDPLWSLIGGISWSAGFAAVAFSPLRLQTIVARCAALGLCGAVLLASGVLEYLYTLPQYTARAQFAAMLTRPANVNYASILFTSEYAKYCYTAFIVGYLLVFVALRGRPRVLVAAGAASLLYLFIYGTAFLLVQPDWWLPLPIYVEQSMWALLTAAAVAGYWGALQQIALLVMHLVRRWSSTAVRTWPVGSARIGTIAALVAVAVIPALAVRVGAENKHLATAWALPWSDEPELVEHLSTHIGNRLGEPFRGSALFLTGDYYDVLSMSNLWKHGIPTANEYSQLVTPPILYLETELFKKDVTGELNRFMPWVGAASTYEILFKTLPALGVRYVIGPARFPKADEQLLPARNFPRRQPRASDLAMQAGDWEVYEFSDPNVGNYSPTSVFTAISAAEIVARLANR